MKTAVCIVVLCLCCACLLTTAQTAIHFNRITQEDGLAHDVIYDLHQDRNGFLWIATHGGLDRYDGYHFKHYRYNPDDSNSISGNFVHCIKEDAKGILWLTNNNGLNSLDPATGIIKRFAPSPATLPRDMNDMMLVNDSILLIAAINAVYIFNTHQHVFTEIKIPVELTDFGYAKFRKDNRGNIYLGNESRRVNLQYNTLGFAPASPLPGKLTWANISNTFYDAKDNAWQFGYKAPLLLTKNISGNQVQYPFTNNDLAAPENALEDFLEDENRFWICTNAGLVYYDYLQNKFYRYTQEPGNAASLNNNRIMCMLKDKNGLYWAGTFGSGLCYFNINTKFKNLAVDAAYSDANRKIYGLRALHSGRIIVGTMAGGGKAFILEKNKTLHELDYAKDFKTPVFLKDIVLELTGRPYDSKDSSALYNYLLVSQNGPPSKHFVTENNLKAALKSAHIIKGYDKIWLNYPGRQLYDGKKNHWYTIQASVVVSVTNNHFLFATNNGLVEFDANTDSVIKTWLPDPKDPYSISGSFISCIVPDGKGNYWIGTSDGGFNYWNVKAYRFYHYTTREGLPDNKVCDILPDKHDRLWISTDKGLSCFNTVTKSFSNFSKADGLINTQYTSGPACIDNDGWFYFGGMSGIDYFHPDSIQDKNAVPVLQLSSFRVYEEDRPLYKSYALATDDNNIQLEFTANDFANASKLILQYQLEGVDRKWISMAGGNSAFYHKLLPGSYRFRIKGSYDGKNWSKLFIVNLTIATPWYESWWFYTLLVLIVIILGWALFNFRLQQQLNLYRMRNRISRDLHDDVGATLSGVKAYAEILENDPDNPVIAELIKEDAAEMIEKLEVIAWATNPHHDRFESLYNKVQRYAAPVCAAKNISFKFITDGIAHETVIQGEIRQNIFLIVKEAVNNSVKYATSKSITVQAAIHSGKFLLSINDDGIGFDTTHNSEGNGLKNMRSRIQEIGGDINFISEQDKGTHINIQLHYPFKYPKQNNHTTS